jgi:hypothetical protein
VKGKFVKGEALDNDASNSFSGSHLVFRTEKDTSLRDKRMRERR